jgi:hypothetical protein
VRIRVSFVCCVPSFVARNEPETERGKPRKLPFKYIYTHELAKQAEILGKAKEEGREHVIMSWTEGPCPGGNVPIRRSF